MQLKKYNPQVDILWATPEPEKQIYRACSNTLKGKFAKSDSEFTNEALIKYLIHADHTSVFGHALMSFRLTKISRACADQIMRHSTAAWTSSSTHYQSHNGYDGYVDTEALSNDMASEIASAINDTYRRLTYRYNIEVARQILPLATEVSIIGTMSARTMIRFFKQRMCLRNTMETILLANAMLAKVNEWFPLLAEQLGAECQHGKCKQGRMACDFNSMKEKLLSYKKGISYVQNYNR